MLLISLVAKGSFPRDNCYNASVIKCLCVWVWLCESVCVCKEFYLEECVSHGPPVFVSDTHVEVGVSGRAARTVPAGIRLLQDGEQVDVCCADQDIPKGALFGPYQGEMGPKEQTPGPFSWVVGTHTGLSSPPPD